MRRNPTNKSKTATAEIADQIVRLKDCISANDRRRAAILAFMGDASFVTDENGDVIAQRLRTKSGGDRLELM
jgi:signal transduction histidine kinase